MGPTPGSSGRTGTGEDVVLTVESISKRFAGVTALDNVSLELRRHEVVGLVGENGSGKSTLLKILSGVQRADGGRMLLRGQEVSFSSTAEALSRGVGMVYQEQSLIPAISVAENIFFGLKDDSTRHGLYRWGELNKRAAAELAQLGIAVNPRLQTERLSFADRQMVEIVKVLQLGKRSNEAPIVIFDEPTSVLEKHEIELLFSQIKRLREEGSVIFVSHRLEEVLEVADRIYVLRDGKCVATGAAAELPPAELFHLMVGREVSSEHYGEVDQSPYQVEVPVLELRDVSVGAACAGVSFVLHKGEVLGIVGVVGSGREALCRALMGALPVRAGHVLLDNRPVHFRSPAQAVEAGVGFVPAERRTEGVAMGLSVAENIVLAAPQVVCNGPFLARKHWREVVRGWSERLRIRTPGPRTDVALLSGGNQQKVVLAKWLAIDNLRVLILDHPARGVDIGAKEEVYRLVRQLAKDGMAVILLGDTLEEVIALSHTILVMKDGVVRRRFEAPRGSKPSEVDIVEQMV
jgi:ribose transport system ATP-binding protein